MISPPEIKIYDDTLATFWIDKDGILNVIAKPVTRTLENTRAFINRIKKILNGKKVYVISDLTPIKEVTEEAREYYKSELPSVFKAIAMVSSSEFGRMVGAVFNVIFNPTIPAKIFNHESDARAWLKELEMKGEPIIPSKVREKKVQGLLLLVDNDVTEEKLLKIALEEGNWNVAIKFFAEPRKALDYLRETRDEIFLIISDINMPGMDGFAFKKAIDADEELSKKCIPFIFASNSVSKEDIARAYDNKVQGYFQKPVDLIHAVEMFDKIFNYWLISRHPYKKNF